MSGKQFKLTYFEARARADLIRIVLTACDKPFEDVRITFADWPALKPKTPSGVLPVLETPCGKTLVQSNAIARHLARRFELYGKSIEEHYLVDRMVEEVTDVNNNAVDIFHAEMDKNPMLEQFKTTFNETTGPRLLQSLTNFLDDGNGKDGFAVGDHLTLADLSLVAICELLKDIYPELIAGFPRLLAHEEHVFKVKPALEAWAKRQPKCII